MRTKGLPGLGLNCLTPGSFQAGWRDMGGAGARGKGYGAKGTENSRLGALAEGIPVSPSHSEKFDTVNCELSSRLKVYGFVLSGFLLS